VSIIIRLIGRVDGQRTEADGHYVNFYDPELKDGACTLAHGSDPRAAHHFPTLEAAIAYYRQVCPNMPEDSPGHTNRPLTVYTIELVEAED
jgi:hypothetical protein